MDRFMLYLAANMSFYRKVMQRCQIKYLVIWIATPCVQNPHVSSVGQTSRYMCASANKSSCACVANSVVLIHAYRTFASLLPSSKNANLGANRAQFLSFPAKFTLFCMHSKSESAKLRDSVVFY